jgi:hypothetical protein
MEELFLAFITFTRPQCAYGGITNTYQEKLYKLETTAHYAPPKFGAIVGANKGAFMNTNLATKLLALLN